MTLVPLILNWAFGLGYLFGRELKFLQNYINFRSNFLILKIQEEIHMICDFRQ